MSENGNPWKIIGKVFLINLLTSFVLAALGGALANDRDAFYIFLGFLTWLVAIPLNFILFIVCKFRRVRSGYTYGFLLATFVIPLIGFSTCAGFMPPLNFH